MKTLNIAGVELRYLPNYYATLLPDESKHLFPC
jgi:hypothetical protein